ncbi:reverse transcriptase domain-containing protein [Tanacetum coccineum]
MFAIFMNKVPRELEDRDNFFSPCAFQELKWTSVFADSGACINLLPYSIYKILVLVSFGSPTRMTLELANRSISHPMGIAEDVVVRVDGFTFLADFVVVNFEPDPRVPIILGRPFLRTAKALIDLEFQEDVEIKNSNVSDEPVFLNTPLSDKDECFSPEDDNDEIDDFLAMEVSSNLEEGYFDSEGDITFLDNLLSDDDSHNLDSKFAGEPLTFPARNDREFEEYLSLMTVLNEISTSQVEAHSRRDLIFSLFPDILIPPGVDDVILKRGS